MAWWQLTLIIVGSIILFAILAVIFYKAFFKRFFDIVLSAIALLVLSPVYLITSILVRSKLGTPVIFTQVRPGKDNKLFKMHKFRTMTNEKDSDGNLLPDEKRLTAFGRFLRSISIDELPEIWDIFRGKMSIIGPRPQLVKDLIFMDENEKRRHIIRPGLTGLAQVNGRNNIGWDEKFAFDLKYVSHVNIFTDIKIFFKSVLKVFRREDISAEGMATALDYGDWLLATGKIDKEIYTAKLEELKNFDF